MSLLVISFTRPSPVLVLQVTNAGVRRSGYEASITSLNVEYLNTYHKWCMCYEYHYSLDWLNLLASIPYEHLPYHSCDELGPREGSLILDQVTCKTNSLLSFPVFSHSI